MKSTVDLLKSHDFQNALSRAGAELADGTITDAQFSAVEKFCMNENPAGPNSFGMAEKNLQEVIALL